MSAIAPQPKPKRGLIRRTLRKWWLPILALWVVGSAGFWAVIYKSYKPTYRAFSILRVDPLPTDLYGVRGGGEPMEALLATQVQLIASPNVLAAAGVQPKVVALPRVQNAGDVVLELKKVIQVGVVPGTSLIEVSMVSESPQEAATLVNAVVTAFMAAHNDWTKGNTESQVKTLEDYLDDLKKKSDVVDKEWRRLVSKEDLDSGLFVTDQAADGTVKSVEKGAKRSSITLGQFKKVHEELFQTRLELAIAEERVKAAKAAASNAEKNAASPADEALLRREVERRFKRDPQVIELSTQMIDTKAKLDEIRKASRPADDPAEQAARDKLKELDARFDRLWEARGRQIREEILADKPNLDRELLEAEAKVRDLSIKQKALQDTFNQLEVKNRRQAADEVDLALIHEQRASLSKMKETVVLRLEQLSFEARGEARIRVYNEARAPGAPISDSRFPLMALAPIFMLPIAFAFYLGVEAFSGPTLPASTVPAEEEPPAEV